MNQRRAPRGKPPAASGTNAGAKGAILLGVAVVIGIVLLQQFDSKTGTITSTGGGRVTTSSVRAQATTTTTTSRRIGLTTVPQVTTTTTVRARGKAEVRVLVANGSGQRGLAGSTTNALKAAGYTNILTPADATVAVDKTVVQYADGYEAEARELAGALSLPVTVVARLASPPVAAADLDDAKLVVVLGADVVNTTSTAPGATTSTTRRL